MKTLCDIEEVTLGNEPANWRVLIFNRFFQFSFTTRAHKKSHAFYFHRVRHASSDRTVFLVPLFVNPGLAMVATESNKRFHAKRLADDDFPGVWLDWPRH